MDEKIEYFITCLNEAISKIESSYFSIKFMGMDEPVYRERIYCYELYHQLRIALKKDYPFVLHGELDKSKYPYDLVKNKIPDFLVHTPGSNDNNLIIMEVKPVSNSISEILKDFDKFEKFLSYGYERAILLLFGQTKDRNKIGVLKRIIRDKISDTSTIQVLWHDFLVGEVPRPFLI